MSDQLHKLSLSIENYPELKSNQNVLQLQESLASVEEEIAAARRAFNAAVNDYNNALEMIPSNIMASLMGLRKKAFFAAPSVARENVQIKKLSHG